MRETGSCTIAIYGDELDFCEIEEKFSIKATRKIKKGEISSKVIGPTPQDAYIVERKFDKLVLIDKVISEMLSQMEKIQLVRELSQKYSLKCRCFVQSDFAQVCIDFSPETLAQLSQRGIKLEIAILSWGGVLDE